ncbi:MULTISPECIES: TetR/AcrR family transcriptional regulator [unclassified Arcicella]|uniref:TetR/AcrR family transcriptional regulator n=1 Tax=unclassified Arcicella TaxID=2644986 RepID=UPI00285973D9|nr:MULTISPECIES: TetR/AcrR family transcriptional regulator [unclassified Arcicella]MDR6563355.1 AcrR family transcriptional regulator [Arcicella sp. BE51]MDR6813224.1 AcrR family transcriptional regulator [Arcicella sp. BE140]MDR6824538.1 AcrR family transcriptional regulator [Arcicella sp. BE139]
MEIKERIIIKAKELFFRYGVKSVTMDDIANELGISKKTIYLHFEDKDDIVFQLFQREMKEDKCEWEELHNSSKNVIDRMVKSMEVIKQAFAEVNPSTLFDIKKYHPRSWNIFQEHKEKFILESIKKDLIEGIEQGLFRAEIKIDILARMRLEQIEMGFDPSSFSISKFTIVEVQLELLDHFIRGVLTEKGTKIYNEYQQK